MSPREDSGQLLRDPRRARIHQGLQLIGEGPAAFYRDACRILDAETGLSPQVVRERDERAQDQHLPPLQLVSGAHLVGHLFREIESAIRAVLLPANAQIDLRSKEKHRLQIEAILKTYDLDQDETLRAAWYRLTGDAGLHERAHRNNLARPRSLDGDTRDYFSNAEIVFDVVLRRFEERYDDTLKLVDQLAAKEAPTKTDLEALLTRVPNNLITLNHFFSQASSPTWLDLLDRKGVFVNPPEPIGDEDDPASVMPPWPASRFLARMAAAPELQERVGGIALSVPITQNFRVHEDLADVALHVPIPLALQFVDRAKSWCQDPWFSRVADKIEALITRFLEAGEVDAALQLASALFDPENRPAGALPEGHEAWVYEQALNRLAPSLVAAGGLAALKILTSGLAKLLEDAESFHLWRPAIEPNDQNLSYGSDARHALINAVRDGGVAISTADPRQIPGVVEHLEAAKSPVLDRIALHVLRVTPNVPIALLESHLLDRDLLNDSRMRHEYTLLAQARLGDLRHEDQLQIVQRALERAATRAAEIGPDEEGHPQEAEAKAKRARAFEHQALERFRGALPEEFRTRHEELMREFGRAEHSEFLSYHGADWAGPTSPKTDEELGDLSTGELVAFLKAWTPEVGPMKPSREGLARELSEVVAKEPERFAPAADTFRELHPAYVRGLLGGLAGAARTEAALEWKPVLELCIWALEQGDIEPASEDDEALFSAGEWAGARNEIGRLLENAFQRRTLEPPLESRDQVWSIVKRLANDPEPTPEYEAQFVTSSESAYDRAINTIRGTGVELAVLYGLWVKRQFGEEAFSPDAVPEFRALLERHLDPSIESSVAVHSMYGRWLPWIYLLAPEWTVVHLDEIFPSESGEELLREAAWHAFIRFCSPYDEMLPLLRNEYAYAIGELQQPEEQSRRSAERLGDHLMVFYLRGQICLDDELLTSFFATASESTRRDAMRYVGRVMYDNGDLEAMIKSRATLLWENRAAGLAANPPRKNLELEAFGWWFAAKSLDADWRLAQLERVLYLTPAVEPDHLVFDEFVALVREHPVAVLACVRRMIEGARDRWRTFSWRQELRQTLESALRSDNPQAVRNARAIVNLLVARGEVEYRTLLDEAD